jgi:hypothetical protein
MRVGLGIGERLMVLSLLPKEGSFVTLRLIRGLIDRLGLSPEEITKYNIVEEEGNVRWMKEGNEPLEFEFADAETDIIKKELKRMDSENKLPIDLFTVYEKFC